jgi:hypothetical protein
LLILKSLPCEKYAGHEGGMPATATSDAVNESRVATTVDTLNNDHHFLAGEVPGISPCSGTPGAQPLSILWGRAGGVHGEWLCKGHCDPFGLGDGSHTRFKIGGRTGYELDRKSAMIARTAQTASCVLLGAREKGAYVSCLPPPAKAERQRR